MRRLKLLVAICCVSGFGCVGVARAEGNANDWTPERAWLVKLEKHLSPMPRGAAELDAYVRYYRGAFKGRSRVLYGFFVVPALLEKQDLPRDSDDRIRIGAPPEYAVQAYDLGCSAVFLTIDVETNRVTNWMCDGGA